MLLPSTVNLKTGESITFTATGGTTPYTFTVEPAEPDGGTIDAGVTTALYTAPPTAGTYIVTVTDRSNNSTEATVMATAAIPLSVTPVSSTVPVGAVVTLVASGGNGSYEFVPPGTGILIHSGSSNMATYQPTVAVPDPGAQIEVISGPETASAYITSFIPLGLQISPLAVSLTTGQVFTFSAAGGTSPYTYSVVAGTGTIDQGTGDFTAPSVAELGGTVRVTDDVGGTSDATVDVFYPLTIVPTDVYVVTNGTYIFSASGGKPPYGYSATNGSFVGDIYTAPGIAGSDTVWVEDALHNASYATVHVYSPASYWDIQSVDTELKSGQYASLALDADDHPHVAYYESGGQQAKELRLASWDGSAWSSQVVDGTTSSVGQHASLAIDGSGFPRISYYDGDPRNRDLRYVAWDGSGWSPPELERPVDTTDNVGQYTSLALDPTTHYPRISYYDSTNRSLKYASWNGTAWEVTVVDAAGDVGKYSSLALDPDTGRPRIAYYDVTNQQLKYAYWDGSAWQFAYPDPVVNRGEYCSLALNASSGNPFISYYDAVSHALFYTWNDGSWHSPQRVDPSPNDRGMYSSIALDASGHPRISYYDNTLKKLVFASFDAGWTIRDDIDPSANVGMYSSLRLKSDGKAVIAYYASSTQDLKVAEQP